MDPYRFARIFVSGLVIAISCALAFLFFSRAAGNSNDPVGEFLNSAKSDLAMPSLNHCSPVIESCEVEISKEEQICNPSKLITEVKREIANPIAAKSCGDVLDKMKTLCGTGCSLKLDSLISVPGEVDIEISYIDPQSKNRQILTPGMKIPDNACTATGKRLLNLKADCG